MRPSRTDDEYSSFVASKRAALVRLGWALTGDLHSGEDLAQGAFDRLWPRWRKVSSTGDAWPYVQRIAVNLASTGRRRRRHTAEVLTSVFVESPALADDMSRIDLRETVAAWLDQLPAGQRATVTLRFMFDLSVEETASIMSLSTGAVKSQTSKALSNLRAIASAASNLERLSDA